MHSPRPTLEPTYTEQALRVIGWATVGVSVLMILLWLAYRGDNPEIAVVAPMLAIAGLCTAPVTFALAEILARLRFAQERAMLQYWEQSADRGEPSEPSVARRDPSLPRQFR